MGAAAAFVAGLIVAVVGAAVAADDWVDTPVRIAGGVFAVMFGLGTVLHALGVW